MRLSNLFTRTAKESAQSDVSRNARLLTRAGYIDQLMAGVYSFLPLGLRVLNRIETIIREEMDRIGGQEIFMPALQPREIWDRTGRWDKVDVLFKLKGAGDRDLALGPTHEEAVTPLVTSFIRSYRDLPRVVYQIQTKFRDEPRAKSGLLRGREFRMKDMYSFHADEASLDEFYGRAIAGYQNIYRRCGIGSRTLLTYASGGTFSKYSHEFQTVTPYGEDVIYRIGDTDTAINKEIIGDESVLAELMPGYKVGDEARLEELKAIEVGNIFKLGSRFTDAFSAQYTDSAGTQRKIVMGCYGLGPSRLMGTLAECLADEKGLVWPQEISPYRLHLVSLVRDPGAIEQCDRLYNGLAAQGIEVLYDDRQGPQAGEKLADADLIGIAHRIVVSRKTLAAGGVEWKARLSNESAVITLEKLHEILRPRLKLPDIVTS
jgi:prolyl-tRNA synthetase